MRMTSRFSDAHLAPCICVHTHARTHTHTCDTYQVVCAEYNADEFYGARSGGVQVRDLNPKPCVKVCMSVCEFAREVNTPCRRPLALARSGRLGTENCRYLHSVFTCSLTGRARVHTHEQYLRCLPRRSSTALRQEGLELPSHVPELSTCCNSGMIQRASGTFSPNSSSSASTGWRCTRAR